MHLFLRIVLSIVDEIVDKKQMTKCIIKVYNQNIEMSGGNNMEELLKQILGEITSIKGEISGINTRLNNLESGQNDLMIEVKEVNRKTSIILEQTANLTEFETNVTSDLTTLKKDVSFIGHKEYQNEKDVYTIKKQLEIIK